MDQENINEILVKYLRSVRPNMISDGLDASQLKLYRILDSIEMLEFIVYLETIFGIKIKDEDILARNFDTVASLTAFITQKLPQRLA